jgi:hypothetical protein
MDEQLWLDLAVVILSHLRERVFALAPVSIQPRHL